MQEWQEILDSAAAELEMSNGLRGEHGHILLQIGDDIQIQFLLNEEDRTVLQTAVIGEYRQFGDSVMSAILAANRPGRALEGFALGGIADTGFFALSARYLLDELDGPAFCRYLDGADKAVTAWRVWFDHLDATDIAPGPCPANEAQAAAPDGPAAEPSGDRLGQAARVLDKAALPYKKDDGRILLSSADATLVLEDLPQGFSLSAEMKLDQVPAESGEILSQMLADNLFLVATRGGPLWLGDPAHAPRTGYLLSAPRLSPESLQKALCMVVQDARALSATYRHLSRAPAALPPLHTLA